MTENPNPEKPLSLSAKVALIGGGVIVALLLVVLLLNLFPALIGKNNPQARNDANTVIEVDYHPSQGDLFASMPGKIRPPDDDSVLEHFMLAWDSESFRVPAQPADHYPVAAFGDSFTEGTNVPLPWPDKLAEMVHVPVRNYGYRGYGPREEAEVVAEFAPKEPRTWVLYAFFSGNDLGDISRAELEITRSPFDRLPQLVQQSADQVATQTAASATTHYDFPMPVIIGGNYYEMAFLNYYLWRQPAPAEGYTASSTFQLFSEALDTMAAALPENTCRALIFIPTKEQLYYPYIYDSERQWLRLNAFEQYLDSSNRLQLRPITIDPALEPTFIARLNDQRDAVQQLVSSKAGWHFIDLLPVFQEQVGEGKLLYYPYDTHWNQAGHTLAAQTIATYMDGVEGCSE